MSSFFVSQWTIRFPETKTKTKKPWKFWCNSYWILDFFLQIKSNPRGIASWFKQLKAPLHFLVNSVFSRGSWLVTPVLIFSSCLWCVVVFMDTKSTCTSLIVYISSAFDVISTLPFTFRSDSLLKSYQVYDCINQRISLMHVEFAEAWEWNSMVWQRKNTNIQYKKQAETGSRMPSI